jgi:hypothetical protein
LTSAVGYLGILSIDKLIKMFITLFRSSSKVVDQNNLKDDCLALEKRIKLLEIKTNGVNHQLLRYEDLFKKLDSKLDRIVVDLNKYTVI